MRINAFSDVSPVVAHDSEPLLLLASAIYEHLVRVHSIWLDETCWRAPSRRVGGPCVHVEGRGLHRILLRVVEPHAPVPVPLLRNSLLPSFCFMMSAPL